MSAFNLARRKALGWAWWSAAVAWSLLGLLGQAGELSHQPLPPAPTGWEELPGEVFHPPCAPVAAPDCHCCTCGLAGCGVCPHCGCDHIWRWQLLPDGLIYRSYLAGVKESRMSTVMFNEKDLGALWDTTLGGRVGLLRYGSASGNWPEGWQLDVEGSAQLRMDPEEEMDMVSTDYRVGVPLTYGEGPYQTKFAYYHLSSHLGDEFLLRNPGARRLNYVRDALVLGNSYYWTADLRLYGELEYAFHTDGGAEPLAFQFGIDYSPPYPNGLRGAPFAAANAYLREEVDFGGHFVFQTGWQWRGGRTGKLLRLGLHYLNGKSPQYEFFDRNEEQLGGGLWYDY